MFSKRRIVCVIAIFLCFGYALSCDKVKPLGAYIWYRVHPDYPRDVSQTLDLDGISEPVSIYLDSAGVAHIDAATEADLVLATGFTHGRSRFFAMDMLRRIASGCVSELVGEQPFLDQTTVEFDRMMFGWGFGAASERDVAELDEKTREMLEKYVSGVNQAVAMYKPLEYRLIGVDPTPWTIKDSFALGRLNAWTVTHNWHQELSRLLYALHGGADRSEALYNSDAWPGMAALPPETEPHDLLPAIAPELRELFPPRAFEKPKPGQQAAARGLEAFFASVNSASNGWVVGGSRTASGKPMVAGDPHLSHFLPSLMIQQHLRCPGLDVIGITLPGLPFVLAGHNEHVAWAMTSAVGDAIDLYIEKSNPDNPEEVLGLNGFEPLQVAETLIRVRDGNTFREVPASIRSSRHGPLLNDVYPGVLPDWAPLVSICWNSEGVGSSIDAFRRADHAKTVMELRHELSRVATPPTTWMAGDVQGNVALFITGTVPVRKHHRGTFPAPGWLPEYDWVGQLDVADIPHGLAGPEGYYAHGNSLLIDPTRSPVYFHVDSSASYRLERISEMIEAVEKHTPETFAKIQLDNKVHRAKRVLPHILEDLKGAELKPAEQQAYDIMAGWDYHAHADSPAAAIFYATYREAATKALRDEVDKRGYDFIMAQRYSSNAYDLWFEDPAHVVWDDRATEAVETRQEVVRTAFRRAIGWLCIQTGDRNPERWQWGKLHDLHVTHFFGKQKALANFLNLPQMKAAGGLDSVWKSHFDMGNDEHPFRVIAGPVFRMISDLGDIEHGQWVLDTGISGWPGSPHYGDQHKHWKKGTYIPMVTNWEEIQRDASAVLTVE